MTKTLVTGASGLVGSRYVELSRSQDLLVPSLEELDITRKKSVQNYFVNNKIDVVVNFAAYTNAGEGEKQRNEKSGDCWKINVEGVANMLAVLRGQFFLHISTDMVFPGSADRPGPYLESDLPESDSSKVTWYGFTKGEAERRVREKGAILRLIYPVRAKFDNKLDYLRKPLKLYDEGKLYPLFTDQQVSISFIDEVCQAASEIIKQKKLGVFHCGSTDLATPYELICYALQKTGRDPNRVKKSSLVEFLKTVDSPVRYPLFGGLKLEQTERDLGIKFSSWREIINKLANQGISV